MPATSKQKGDAYEMLVVAELTLSGMPAMKMPDNWPHYDVIAQPKKGTPQRISVKARSWMNGKSRFVNFKDDGEYDWLAAVVLMPSDEKEYHREFYLIPRDVFEYRSKEDSYEKDKEDWYCQIDRMNVLFREYQDNFVLSQTGVII